MNLELKKALHLDVFPFPLDRAEQATLVPELVVQREQRSRCGSISGTVGDLSEVQCPLVPKETHLGLFALHR